MVRTVISLEERDHSWLIQVARAEHVSMAEIIRNAIEQYRQTRPLKNASEIEKIVEATKGIWRHGDGLRYQQKLRFEWE